jgi:uncharacterized repeat protein (TIGR03806 family)
MLEPRRSGGAPRPTGAAPGALVLALLTACGGAAGPGDDAGLTDGPADAGVALDAGPPPDGGPPLPPRAERAHCLAGAEALPERLSETGCFAELPTLRPSPDLIPYDLNAPLWTDGAHKLRWIALPPGARVDASDPERWAFPEGAVIVKAFVLEGVVGAAAPWPAEVRLMWRRPGAWAFASYRFTRTATEAWRVDPEQFERVPIPMQGPSGPTTLSYLYPSVRQCVVCHGPDLAVLGPRTDQLDRVHDYGHTRADQLTVLEAQELFTAPPIRGARLADPFDPAAPLEARARAWLHGNCAHCHRPSGWQPPDMTLDLRGTIPLRETETCDVPVQFVNGAPGRTRVVPGDHGASNLWQRLARRDISQMPPLGTSAPDEAAARLVADWIDALDTCP